MNTVKVALVLASIIGLGLLGAVAVVLLVPPSSSSAIAATPTILITIEGGEVDAKYGFSLPDSTISSPGPTIKVKAGEVVKINFANRGKTLHAFAIVQEAKEGAATIFESNVGTGNRPLSPGQQGSAVFKADNPGKFYYVCPVPGHVTLGMHGEFIIEG
jgi:nitrite reductase (NO-forming)